MGQRAHAEGTFSVLFERPTLRVRAVTYTCTAAHWRNNYVHCPVPAWQQLGPNNDGIPIRAHKVYVDFLAGSNIQSITLTATVKYPAGRRGGKSDVIQREGGEGSSLTWQRGGWWTMRQHSGEAEDMDRRGSAGLSLWERYSWVNLNGRWKTGESKGGLSESSCFRGGHREKGK